MAKKITYAEPVDYIPKSVRKELKIGEYAPKAETSTKSAKSPAKKKSK